MEFGYLTKNTINSISQLTTRKMKTILTLPLELWVHLASLIIANPSDSLANLNPKDKKQPSHESTKPWQLQVDGLQ